MKIKKTILLLFAVLSAFITRGQFKGHSGVFFLGGADIPVAESVYANPNISGVVCRFKWESLESSPDVFNWDFIDGEIAKAREANKKISLQPLGKPGWIATELKAQQYFYIDGNKYHSTYGQVLSGILPWDSIYLERLHNIIHQLAVKYANDTTVSYVNAVAGNISRGLPDTVLTDTVNLIKTPFWNIFDYNADTLAAKMNVFIDQYMSEFPNTPLWCSVDYVLFEKQASSRDRNYLASLYVNYGITNYPDRFGLFREDLSACTSLTPPGGSHWAVMKENPCRTGAQMLWSVQDGPDFRMNQCARVTENTKQAVMDSAISRGLDYGMRYVEVYGADILDQTLDANISTANERLIAKGNLCTTKVGIETEPPFDRDVLVFPNPATDNLVINTANKKLKSIRLFSASGQLLLLAKTSEISISRIPAGIYYLIVETDQSTSRHKIIKISY